MISVATQALGRRTLTGHILARHTSTHTHYNRNLNISSVATCRAAMKGKNKSRSRDKDWLTSDDDMYSRSSSPVWCEFGSYMKAQEIKARNPLQEEYISLLQSSTPPIVIATGPAGVAKTYLSNAIGISKLKDGSVKKLVITRPAVAAGSDGLGFMPGTLEEKMDPWLRPIYDVFYKFVSPKEVQNMIANQVIEICPLVFMRGRTFENAWICADEMQNSTPEQMLMLLTRIGSNSKLVINGDPTQHDRKYEANGLADLMIRLDKRPCEDIKVVRFTEDHVERHPVIKTIIRMYS